MSINPLKEVQGIRIPLHSPRDQEKLLKVQEIEKRLPVLRHGGSADLKTRAALLRELYHQRTEELFSKAVYCESAHPTIQALENAKNKLWVLKESMHNDPSRWKEAFTNLPRDYQLWLYWVAWVANGCNKDGKEILQERSDILSIQEPWISLKNGSLIDQLIAYVEQRIRLKTLKQEIKQIEVKDPSSPLLSEKKKTYNSLCLSADLEEFERATVNYSAASEKQRAEIVKWATPRAREWLLDLESIETQTVNAVYPYKNRGAIVQGYETHFSVFAPNAKSITLVLTAYGHEEHRIPMQKSADGVWRISTDKAPHGRTYRYHVEEQQGHRLYRTDPFSNSILENNGITESRVSAVDQYPWQDAQWMQERGIGKLLNKPLSIYEIYVESWKKRDGRPLNYRELADEIIAYQKKMGFSHIELYGVLDNRGGWGYQVHNFFAPNHRLGIAEDFQYLVDKLHQHGIGVILDWIPAHYKHDFHRETTLHDFDGTNLYSAGKSEWGTMFFDFSKEEVKRLLKASALYWLDVMHIDVIRIDAVSHIARRHEKEYPAGIAFLKDLNQTIAERFPDVLMIAEDPSHFPNLTKPINQGGLGFHLKWGTQEGLKLRWFLQTPPKERSNHHQEKFMDHLQYAKHGEKIVFTHSHDEPANRERDFPENKDQTLYKIDAYQQPLEKFADMRNMLAWQILSPSRGHLIHMGDEIGQRRSWNVGIWSHDGSIEWHRLDPTKEKDSAYHLGLQSCVADLTKLYREKPVFRKGEQAFRLCCDHPANNVIAYERSDKQGHGVVVVHNFSQNSWSNYEISLGNMGNLKELKLLFNSDDPKYAGKGTFSQQDMKLVKKDNALFLSLSLSALTTLVLEKIV